MNLRELRYQINFQYIKDIRRYIYDIEQQVIGSYPDFIIQPTPQIPDDVDPTHSRLVLLSKPNNEKNVFLITISQVGITISTSCNNDEGINKSLFNSTADYLYNFACKIKGIVFDVIPSIELSHEIFSIVSGQLYEKFTDFSSFIAFSEKDDEIIMNSTKEVENSYFVTLDRAARKIYDFSEQQIFYPKNNDNNFIGYQVVSAIHISNRLAYNKQDALSKEQTQLKIEDIKRLYNEHL